MTQYTVLWDAALETHFIDAWVRSDSRMRAILTDVANWIDTNLAIDAELKGRNVSEAVRILAIPNSAAQISVAFQVLADDRQVRVLRLSFRQ